MREFELFLAFEVIEILDRLPKKVRSRLLERFQMITYNPYRLALETEYDDDGRLLHIDTMDSYNIVYWIDSADLHLKILKLQRA